MYIYPKARSYGEWQTTANQLDTERGFDKWRAEKECSLYDYKMLQKRINSMNEMISRGDVFDLMFRIRGGLARDQYGIF